MPVCPVWLPRRSYLGNRCPGCGYDLSGSLTGRCPECGAVYDRVPGRRARGLSLRAAVRGRWVVVSGFFGVIHLLAVVGVLMYDLEQRFPLVAVFTMLLSLVSPRQSVWGFALVFALNSALWGVLLGTVWTGFLLFASDLPAFCRWWPQRLRFWGARCRECGSDLACSRARRSGVQRQIPQVPREDSLECRHDAHEPLAFNRDRDRRAPLRCNGLPSAPLYVPALFRGGIRLLEQGRTRTGFAIGHGGSDGRGVPALPIGLAINSVLWGAVLAALYIAALGVVSSLRRAR